MGSHRLTCTTTHITTKMSTKVFLLTILFSLAQAQEVEVEEMDLSLPTLADLGLTKAALLESLAGLSNTTALFERLGDFFDFQNAGQTQLGKVMAWKGDLIQPIIMFALGAIIIYSTVELILVLLGGLFDFKLTVFGRAMQLGQAVLEVFINSINGVKIPLLENLNALVDPAVDDLTPVADAGRRFLDKVSDGVMNAINKYN